MTEFLGKQKSRSKTFLKLECEHHHSHIGHWCSSGDSEFPADQGQTAHANTHTAGLMGVVGTIGNSQGHLTYIQP